MPSLEKCVEAILQVILGLSPGFIPVSIIHQRLVVRTPDAKEANLGIGVRDPGIEDRRRAEKPLIFPKELVEEIPDGGEVRTFSRSIILRAAIRHRQFGFS